MAPDRSSTRTRRSAAGAEGPGKGGSFFHGLGHELVWSPNGSRFAFSSHLRGKGLEGRQIYVVNADGSGLRWLTREGDNFNLVWSPDGLRIAFVNGPYLFTMAADGSDVKKIEGVLPHGAIAWNPVS